MMDKHNYQVMERQNLPGRSPASAIFPECLYVLKRAPDGKLFRVTLSKSLGWKPGDIVEVEELYVEGVKN